MEKYLKYKEKYQNEGVVQILDVFNTEFATNISNYFYRNF